MVATVKSAKCRPSKGGLGVIQPRMSEGDFSGCGSFDGSGDDNGLGNDASYHDVGSCNNYSSKSAPTEETLTKGALSPVGVETNPLLHHETKVAMAVAQQQLWHWQKVLILTRRPILASDDSQRNDKEATACNMFVN